MRPAILCALLALSPALAIDDSDLEDKARLQGTWKVVRVEEDGEAIPADALADQVLVFEGDKYFVKVEDEVVEEGTFVLRSDTSPRQIDLKIVKGDDAGSTQLGLYKFDGEKLVAAFARAGAKERPGQFKTAGEGAAALATTLERRSD
jgi:uncharacterized protein (TIGR03067 family)